jgi:hypothetical protein
MNIISTPFPGAVRSRFCVQTYEWLARRDGVEVDPERGMPLPKWGPVILISDVLEATYQDPCWDCANDDLVYWVAATWTDLAALESIAREVTAFRRWLAAEGLCSDEGVDAIEALVDAAPALRARRANPTTASGLPSAASAPRPHVPRRERRAAERAERKRRRREAARRA